MSRHLASLALLVLALTCGGCGSDEASEGTAASVGRGGAASGQTGRQVRLLKGYMRGFEEARRVGKPMLVLFTAQGCVYCQQMLTETFVDRFVGDLSAEFVCIQVDAEEEPGVCRDFGVHAYPTVQFMSAEGVPLNRLTGKRSSQEFALDMQMALDAAAGRMASAAGTGYR